MPPKWMSKREKLDPHHLAGHLVASMVRKPRLDTGKQIICWRLISAACASPCLLRPLHPPKLPQHFRQTSRASPIYYWNKLRCIRLTDTSALLRSFLLQPRWVSLQKGLPHFNGGLNQWTIPQKTSESVRKALDLPVPLALITFKLVVLALILMGLVLVLTVLTLLLLTNWLWHWWTEFRSERPSRPSENKSQFCMWLSPGMHLDFWFFQNVYSWPNQPQHFDDTFF